MRKSKLIAGVILTIMMGVNAYTQSNPYKIKDADYQKMIDETIVSTGNNYRLKKVLEKIRKGETVHIAALGGSVTEGAGPAKFTDGYAYQFFRAVKKVYAPGDGSNLLFNNAGLSGTPSLLGRVRYKADVVDVCGQNPDLLIVEFAVNDGGEEIFQKSFEAIVRDALLASPDTAVIAIYSAATYGNTSFQKKPVSDYYEIPHINMLDVVNNALKDGTFKKEEYYTDIVHPTYEGHELMKDCLMNLLAKVDKEKMDPEVKVPEKLYKEPGLNGLIRIFGDDENVKITKGGFWRLDANCQTIKKTNKSDFPKNWHKAFDSGKDPFKIELNCKSFVWTYKVQSASLTEKFGKAEVWVDGKLFKVCDGGAPGGWNNNECLVLINEKETGKHTVEVKMMKGSELLGFTIVAMAYSK